MREWATTAFETLPSSTRRTPERPWQPTTTSRISWRSRHRAVRPGLEVGICGEHGGDPDSIAFFHAAGLDYVSCSPFRVPIARVAAAQVASMG